jgi:NAD(P)-dependent dehydrogenase (short-subunit alcohol dehydrogenase family)
MRQKVVLITGASSGIGRASVLGFAQAGWRVVATMRQPAKEQELQKIPNVTLLPLDVTSDESVAGAVAAAVDQLGKIDVLLNNAGYGLMGAFEETDLSKIEKQFHTNVFGLMRVTKAVIPYMRKQGSGRIINVSSIGGRIGIPLYSSYHATKFAVEGFTESLSFELKPFGIDVVLIEPGAIATNFLGSSADIVRSVSGSPYKNYFERVFARYEATAGSGSQPSEVAAKIVRAASVQSPSLRVPAAGGAPALMALRKILPDCAVHKVVASQTKG